MQGFQVLPNRWIGERTFAWIEKYRRLSKDYEALPETSEAFIVCSDGPPHDPKAQTSVT